MASRVLFFTQRRAASITSNLEIGAGGRSSISGINATVFGASGFLGRYVTNYLGKVGSQVVVASRCGEVNVRHLKLMGDLGRIIPMDISLRDLDSLRHAISRSNVVINCTGKFWDTRNFRMEDVHRDFPGTLAELCKELGIEKFIHVSCLGADSSSDIRFLRTKGAGEDAVREVFPDAVIIRPGLTIGPEDRYLNWLAQMDRQYGFYPLFFNDSTISSPVYVGDVARAIFNAAHNYDNVKGRTYELAGPDTYTQQELFEVLQRIANVESRALPLPAPLSKLFGKVCDKVPDTFTLGAMSHERIMTFSKDSVLSNEPGVGLAQDLGVTPRHIEEASRLYLKMWRRGTAFSENL